jgi:hypothetical protein
MVKATQAMSKIFTLCLFLTQGISLNAEEKSSLHTQLVNPPDHYRSGVKWEWCNGMVNRSGITGDLEAMRRAGLGGGKIFNIGGIEGPSNEKQWHRTLIGTGVLSDRLDQTRRVQTEHHPALY